MFCSIVSCENWENLLVWKQIPRAYIFTPVANEAILGIEPLMLVFLVAKWVTMVGIKSRVAWAIQGHLDTLVFVKPFQAKARLVLSL